MMNQTEIQITELYKQFISELSIDPVSGILGKISNHRYVNDKLRLSGYPYIGANYETAKRKILFVGLDIGIDEYRKENSYHTIESRRKVISGSVNGCTELGYNNHISGTYAMTLYILKGLYGWEQQWDIFKRNTDNTFFKIINDNKKDLPIDVLDYVAFTNIHKFVTVCRGCKLEKNPPCKTTSCLQGTKNRTGNDNRRWYNEKEEIDFFLKELETLNPDILYFQGSNIFSNETLIKLSDKYEIWIANHPSAWNVGANKSNYVDSERLMIIHRK